MKTALAPHALGKIKEDLIFFVGAKAREAKATLGKENVLDASIGILLDDEGELALLPSVEEATQRLKPAEVAPYAPIGGLPQYREDVLEYLLGSSKDNMPANALATAGATGALRLAIWNFLEPGDAIISHDHFWSPYGTMARDALRELETFSSFTETGDFNVQACLDLTESVLKRQGRALLIINSPCHNPTGMCLKPEEAQALKSGLCEIAARHPDLPITLLMDIAYWEFEKDERNAQFVATFNDLPQNLIFTMAYSLSKSLTRYGFRTGALVVRASEQSTVDEIIGTCATSIRSMWSNTPRIGQAVFSTIFRDESLRKQLAREQGECAHLCNNRGAIFAKEAQACGLQTTPYSRGFFATIPCDNSMAIAEKLFKEQVYLVPMKKGLRVAFCALPTTQIPGLAERIKNAL